MLDGWMDGWTNGWGRMVHVWSMDGWMVDLWITIMLDVTSSPHISGSVDKV